MSAARPRPKLPTPPLHCAKCGEHNSREAELCTHCQALLWQICPHCKKRCPRTASRCIRCVEPLGGGMLAAVKRAAQKMIRKVGR